MAPLGNERTSLGGSDGKESACSAGDPSSIPESEKGMATHPSIYIKINSKLITDLNVNFKITKLSEENAGENLSDLALGIKLLDMTPKAEFTEGKKLIN